jgi:hypothetical protein
MAFELTDKHYGFLMAELNTSKEALEGMSESELDDFYEKVLDIELEETPSNGEDLSERGEIAIEIVDIMADALGYVQEEEDEE